MSLNPRKVAKVDRLIHEPARLMIITILSTVESADFLFLERETGLTKGNLSSHLSKLESAGYVEIEKTYRGKIPLTICAKRSRCYQMLKSVDTDSASRENIFFSLGPFQKIEHYIICLKSSNTLSIYLLYSKPISYNLDSLIFNIFCRTSGTQGALF